MPMTEYALWLVEATFPADEHKLSRHVYLQSPDDILNLLKKVLPGLNKDMRVVGEPRSFAMTEQDAFDAARVEAEAKDRLQNGWKAPGKYDLSLTQEQVDKIRTDRESALAALQPTVPAKPAKPTPANA